MGTAQLTVAEHQAEITERLHVAGKTLGDKLQRSELDKLLILIPDAHSPKNQFLVEGAQQVFGGQFPVTGGSANKNAGQTFVYYRGKLYQDSAVALLLSGNFQVSMSGRLAKDKEAVIRTAAEGAAEAFSKMTGTAAGRPGLRLRRPARQVGQRGGRTPGDPEVDRHAGAAIWLLQRG